MARQFNYRAVNSVGQVEEGTLTADSAEAVMGMLRNQGSIPIEINAKTQSREVAFGSSKLDLNDVVLFCRQSSTMLKAGMDLSRCLDVLSAQAESKKLKNTLVRLSESVKKGTELSKAMEQEGDAFPYLLRRSVQAGEMSGQLAEVVEKMAEHFEKDMKIRRKIKGAMMYPIILLFITIGAVTILLTKVMPNFVSMFEGSGVELPGLTQFVLGLSDLLVKRGFIILIVIVLIEVLRRFLLRNPGIRMSWDKWKLKMPLVGRNMSKIVTARFTRTLSTMLYSGVAIVQAMEAAGETTSNKYVEYMVAQAVLGIEKGMGMTAQLAKAKLFPGMMLSMIGIGEESGNLDQMLEKTADYYDDEMDQAIDAMITMIEPIMIVFMGGLIGTIVVAMYLPMFEIINIVQ